MRAGAVGGLCGVVWLVLPGLVTCRALLCGLTVVLAVTVTWSDGSTFTGTPVNGLSRSVNRLDTGGKVLSEWPVEWVCRTPAVVLGSVNESVLSPDVVSAAAAAATFSDDDSES